MPGKIDLVLGASVYAQILESGIRGGNGESPIAQKTALGCSLDCELLELLQRFWQQEEIVPSPNATCTPEEAQYEHYFKTTHSHDAHVRFVVRLPFRKSVSDFGNSRAPAFRMLCRMETRFKTHASLKIAYAKFLREYLELDHMRLSDSLDHSRREFFLPHHGVIKDFSSTTKLRVVFNGSQKTNLGISLNDCLHIGPKLQTKLTDIIMRWRRHRFVFAADIEKMYRQVRVHQNDRPLQKIFWKNSPSENPLEYLLCTVTYGLACAPYLALRCSQQLALESETTRAFAAEIIRHRQVIGKTLLTYEEMTTLLVQIEAILNSHPLRFLRLLGIGLRGAMKFCGLWIYRLRFNKRRMIIDNIHSAASSTVQLVLKQAVKEQQKITKQNSSDIKKLTVSGDGTWRKRGFTSLYGIVVLIGQLTGKVVDFIVKSAYCAECNYWNKHANTEQYQEWKSNHEENCQANHVGSAGKMEVDAMKELFSRSVEKHGVMYINYVGDGDTKTYTGLVNAKLYGDEIEIIKKECVGHIQKRMGTRLRECKKKNPGIGGKNKLTAKFVDKLSIYYGLAIRRNSNSKDDMKKAIWATFYHYGSTDSKPEHHFCPEGLESWCKWQQAKVKGGRNFRHDYLALPKTVLNAIKPIYEDPSNDKLLERCVGGYTQNSNESFNQLIWKIAPKTMHSEAKIVNIAAFLATCTFNNGVTSLLEVMNVLGISVGSGAHLYAAQEDETSIAKAELQAQEQTKEDRIRRRQQNLEDMNIPSTVEDLHYGPGIDDSMKVDKFHDLFIPKFSNAFFSKPRFSNRYLKFLENQ
ncbi:hypothetical protein ALC57_16049 [Trachymyrmex cornetzi]|uniref:Mutator-like transposase domain-containing protein n=1 Tax=Trachymyrmex cornetzi TaxID=471704 RepID=A0A151IVM8_9HYME|nr:hypothetical protein ALC57_16049 [Trachymyrmex cornetzi]